MLHTELSLAEDLVVAGSCRLMREMRDDPR